jgi:hypothetical protein
MGSPSGAAMQLWPQHVGFSSLKSRMKNLELANTIFSRTVALKLPEHRQSEMFAFMQLNGGGV